MKVVQINVVYRSGSTGKIVYDMHTYMNAQGVESEVYYGRGSTIDEPHIHKIFNEYYSKMNSALSRITGIMYGGCLLSTQRLIAAIKKEKPDVIHVHCINGYFINIYKLFDWLKKNKIPTVLTLHAEFMYTGGCGYTFECEKWLSGCGNCPHFKNDIKSLFLDRTHIMWNKMKKAFEDFGENIIIVSVSPWLKERAEKSPILKELCHKVVLNGLDTNVFRIYDTAYLKKQHNISDEKIVFYVTPNFNTSQHHIKGAHYLIKLAELLKPINVKVFVAGNYDSTLVYPENITFLGKLSDQTLLAKYYSLADLTILTSKKETFSMVVAESLCSGTPVVGFEAGAPETITISEYSSFIEFGDVEKLFRETQRFLNMDFDKEKISLEAHQKYAKEIMTENYLKVYQDVRKKRQQ